MAPRPYKDPQQVRAARRAATYGSFGLLGTYPPTQCGLASFSASLRDGLLAGGPGTEVGVVRMVDEPGPAARAEVVYELRADRHGILVAAGNGAVLLRDVQLEGKKRMAARDFLRGNPVTVGSIFGERKSDG